MPTYKCDVCGVTACEIVVKVGYEVETEYLDECVQDYGSYVAEFVLVGEELK